VAAWTAERVGDQKGRVFLITGANSGIGLEAAKVLVAHDARVLMACRDPAKAKEAEAEVRRAAGGRGEVAVMALDLASLASVRAFADAVHAATDRLDGLINNAGVMALPHRLTADGFEIQIGTNHFGHFVLTARLWDLLVATPNSRVVAVSSGAHVAGGTAWLDAPDAPREPWLQYGNSKLANLWFAYELDRRAKAAGLGVKGVACHPGYAATNLQPTTGKESGWIQRNFLALGNALVAQSPAMGALPTLFAATDASIGGGEFVGPRGPMNGYGYPVVHPSNARSYDKAAAARLWALSTERTGERLMAD